jgi:hypothetical protein
LETVLLSPSDASYACVFVCAQLGGVSLRFALQLDPRLRRSASRPPRGRSDEAEACSGFLQLPPLGWDSLTAAASATWSLPPAADEALDTSSPRHAGTVVAGGAGPGGGASLLEAMLPLELLSAVLRFFRVSTRQRHSHLTHD